MHASRLTGFNVVAQMADSRKASIHAGYTGLTGLAGFPRAHMNELSESIQPKHSFNKFSVRMKKILLTLLTLFRASIHAGSSVTGFGVRSDMTCKEA
jgi:hypothetical protein